MKNNCCCYRWFLAAHRDESDAESFALPCSLPSLVVRQDLQLEFQGKNIYLSLMLFGDLIEESITLRFVFLVKSLSEWKLVQIWSVFPYS